MRRNAGVALLIALLAVGASACSAGGGEDPPAIARTYANPVSLEDEWGEYGLGDPYVFKYNGYYYLYVSTRDTDVGVKVWRSPDLVEWKYEGLCTEDPVTAAAYAPEVRYWNGKFYMYTSPAGQGHYVLVSDSPTGPFRVATDNFGRTIDGTTFVDDDGKWYFYYAGPQGIQAAPMADPLTVEPEEDLTGASMGGWTEGPTVFKRNGKYYMTYTGNHVFSTGYRVNAAVSESPLTGFQGFAGNPVLLRTEGPTVGLGHNSVVRGPDLDSDYMIYHNLEGPGIVGPLRHMNMDRIVWNGDRFAVWGPTSGAQPAPELPAFEDRFERSGVGGDWQRKGGGQWKADAGEGLIAVAKGGGEPSMLLAQPKTEKDFTAEYHVQIRSPLEGEAAAGAVFSYRSDDDYGAIRLDPRSGKIVAEVRRNGKTAERGEAALPANVDLSQLHELRLEKSGRTVRIYVDEMNLLKLDLQSDLGGGKIGYLAQDAEARFGYVAFSDKVDGSGVRSAYAPIPGAVQAVHFEPDSGGADRVAIGGDAADGYYAAGLEKSDSPAYRVNVANEGEYSLRFRVRPGPEGAKFRLMNGKSALTPALVVRPGSGAEEWVTVKADGLKLMAGPQRWKLEILSGTLDFDRAEAAEYAPVTAAKEEFDDRQTSGWTRYEGLWSVKEGQLKASSVQPAKILWGENGWTDYEFEADLTMPEPGGQTGLLVRALNPANGMDQNQNRSDFVQAYYVYADADGIHLAKQNYDTVPLADAEYPMPESGQWLHLKVRAVSNRITVYAGDEAKPILDYVDSGAATFLHGKVGLKSVDTASRFDHASVAPATE